MDVEDENFDGPSSEILNGSQEAELRINENPAPDETMVRELVREVIDQQVEYLCKSTKFVRESAAVAVAVSDEADDDTSHRVEPSPPSANLNDSTPAPEHTQTQQNIIAAEPIAADRPPTTSPDKDLASPLGTEVEPQRRKGSDYDADDKEARIAPIENKGTVEKEPVTLPEVDHTRTENESCEVQVAEEVPVAGEVSEKRSVLDDASHETVAEPGKPMESLLISPENGTSKKLDNGHSDMPQKTSDRLAEAVSREDEEFLEAERQAELELDSELVIHDNGPTPTTHQNEKAVPHSPKEALQEIQPRVPSTDSESKKETGKTGIVKPTSRLVRPQNRVIHTSPQSAGVAARTQSATRPSSAMPKPTVHTAAAVRSLRPPAPRPVAQTSTKEQLNKKPVSRTQSQPRPPITEVKTVSQPTTPKVYRKVVAVSSKIGSFTDHKPSGGNVQIFSETRTYKVQPKVGSLNNVTHTPGGGNVKIPTIKLDFKEKAKPKIDAKSEYVPPVPEKKMISQKLVWNAQSKVGSLDNVKHKPAGGNVQILDQKLEWHAASKVGSMDNIKHKPGGGNVQIFDERIQYVSSTNHKSNSSSMNNVNNQSRTTSRTNIDLLDL